MVLFSTFVQMAEGLHYGIVPYVSRPALGIVSGMVGAGGNLGAVIGSRNIVHAAQPLDTGFINLGIIIVSVSLVMHGLYFPDSGGMLFKAGALGKYDPHLLKPPLSLRATATNAGRAEQASSSVSAARAEKGRRSRRRGGALACSQVCVNVQDSVGAALTSKGGRSKGLGVSRRTWYLYALGLFCV